MPRARWLKPEFFTDKTIAHMDDPIAALVYEALWCWADDGGTCLADPELLKGNVFFRWRCIGVPEIAGALRHLCGTTRIQLYQEGGELYAIILAFDEHQKVHRPSKFRYPVSTQPLTPDSASLVPHYSGTTPPPRLLDSQTPRHLDTSFPPNGGLPVGKAGKAPRAPKAESAPPSWLAVVAAEWEERRGVGAFPWGRAGKALKPLITAGHPPEEIAEHLWSYLVQQRRGMGTIEAFAVSYAEWKPQEQVDKDGVMTAYGERVSRPESQNGR